MKFAVVFVLLVLAAGIPYSKQQCPGVGQYCDPDEHLCCEGLDCVARGDGPYVCVAPSTKVGKQCTPDCQPCQEDGDCCNAACGFGNICLPVTGGCGRT